MKYADLNIKGSQIQSAEQNNEHTKKPKGRIVLVASILIILGLIYVFRNHLKNSFDPVSIVASVSAAELKQTDGRTNILLLGSDKRNKGAVTSVLTDTILVASIGKVDNDVVLISIPRDLWVQSPNGYHEKINAIYTLAENYDEGAGPKELRETIEDVLGIPIHYHALITFDLFEEAVNILGGITVEVENSFTDYFYPIEGKENAPEYERYETIHFSSGVQNMDGNTALKFVRSRKGDNNEGTDFARSKRQQKVIAAIKEKAFSMQTILSIDKIKNLYDAYSGNVDTDIDFSTIQTFYLLSKQIDLNKVISIVLDDRSEANEGGLLYAPEDRTLYGDRYVLVPQTGDYSQIHAFVQRYLFDNK
ncbi:MAG TPA: LCP family protein [bacterium]|jgi:LCP family protein required for cell wall assembly|nr:LCP family protein [bacterium]